MGIALPPFSALFSPLRALIRWLHHLGSFKEPSEAKMPSPHVAPHDGAPRHGSEAAGTKTAHQRPSNGPNQRPLRGNWPFTVSPQTPPAGSATGSVVANSNAPVFTPPASGNRVACGSARLVDGSRSRAAKVVRKAPASGGPGRLVIAGRMADVCAELDRMAASEAALQAY